MDLPYFDLGDHIPKVIHQTFFSKATFPTEIKESINGMKSLNPDWEHRLYDDVDIENFITKRYGAEVLQVYRSIDPAYGPARADIFRYLLMYAEGGVYLDIKSAATLPLSSVIPPDAFYILGQWDNEEGFATGWGKHAEFESIQQSEYQQWHIIAAPGHPFLRAVIKQVITNIQQYNILKTEVGQLGVLRTTGPIPYTLAIAAIKSLHPCHEMNVAKDLGIEYSIYQKREDGAHHSHLFKKNYSKLKLPIVKPRRVRDYFFLCSYRIKMRLKKLKKNALRAFKKFGK